MQCYVVRGAFSSYIHGYEFEKMLRGITALWSTVYKCIFSPIVTSTGDEFESIVLMVEGLLPIGVSVILTERSTATATAALASAFSARTTA